MENKKEYVAPAVEELESGLWLGASTDGSSVLPPDMEEGDDF